MNLLDRIKHRETFHPFRSFVNQIPDAFAVWINLAGTIFSGTAARAVSKPFGTALTAGKSRGGENAFTAMLASPYRDFDGVFCKTHEEGKLTLEGRDWFFLLCDEFNGHRLYPS